MVQIYVHQGVFFMSVQKCFGLFLMEKKLENVTDKTVVFYEYSVGKFLKYLESQNDVVEVNNIHLHVKPYLLSLKESSNISDITYNTLLRGLKVFLRFLHSERFIVEEIKLPKIKKIQSKINPLSPDQLRKILSSFDTTDFLGIRDKTIFSLMIDTGIRLSELTRIELDDISLQEGYIVIRGKGRKQRTVPVGRETKKHIWKFIKQRSKYAGHGVFSLFITNQGTTLSRSGVIMLFRRVKKNMNITGRFHPHLIRHSMAVSYINNGASTLNLQILLGHQDPSTTARYVTLSTANIINQHQKFSPMDSL
jgi:integrase/recombinase XerD